MLEKILSTFDLTQADASMIPVGIVLFFLLWKALGNVIFRPYLRVTENREMLTIGAENKTISSIKEAAKINEEIDQKIHAERTEAMIQKLEYLSAARKEAAKIASEAEAEAQSYLSTKRAEIKAAQDSTLKSSGEMAKRLADEIASKITQQVVQ